MRPEKFMKTILLIISFHVEPVLVLEDIEGVNRNRSEDEYQIKHCQGNQQPIEGVFPELENTDVKFYICCQVKQPAGR